MLLIFHTQSVYAGTGIKIGESTIYDSSDLVSIKQALSENSTVSSIQSKGKIAVGRYIIFDSDDLQMVRSSATNLKELNELLYNRLYSNTADLVNALPKIGQSVTYQDGITTVQYSDNPVSNITDYSTVSYDKLIYAVEHSQDIPSTSSGADANNLSTGVSAYVSGKLITGTGIDTNSAVTGLTDAIESRLEQYKYTNGISTNTVDTQSILSKSESSATADANNLSTGKSAYVSGNLITGTGKDVQDAYDTGKVEGYNAGLKNGAVELSGVAYIEVDPNNGQSISKYIPPTFDGLNLNAPTAATGYHFSTWSPTIGTTSAEVNNKTVQQATLSFKAMYELTQYSITYNLSGGTNSNSNPSTYTIKDAIELSDATRSGYTFGGWSPDGVISAGTIGDKEFTAKWAANTYTLTFNSNGGDTLSQSTKSVTYDSAYGDLPTPTRTGYTFAGWYTSTSGGSQKVSTDTYGTTSNSTLYAHWNINSYTVSLGTGSYITNVTGGGTYTYGSTVTVSCTVSGGWTDTVETGKKISTGTYTGYYVDVCRDATPYFSSWSGTYSSSSQSYTFIMPASDVSLTANAGVNYGENYYGSAYGNYDNTPKPTWTGQMWDLVDLGGVSLSYSDEVSNTKTSNPYYSSSYDAAQYDVYCPYNKTTIANTAVGDGKLLGRFSYILKHYNANGGDHSKGYYIYYWNSSGVLKSYHQELQPSVSAKGSYIAIYKR